MKHGGLTARLPSISFVAPQVHPPRWILAVHAMCVAAMVALATAFAAAMLAVSSATASQAATSVASLLLAKNIEGRLLTVNKAAPRGSQPERTPRESGPKFRIYVGNLPWSLDDARLEQAFSEYGKVLDSRVVYDRESGRSRGFGFVTMSTQQEMDDAIAGLDGNDLGGRTVRVNAAEQRPMRGAF